MSAPKPTIEELLAAILAELRLSNSLVLTEREVIAAYKAGETTLKGWVRDGLPFVPKGDVNGDRSHKIFFRADVEKFLRSRRQTKASTTRRPGRSAPL